MDTEQKQLFEDAIEICRSAMAIAARCGKETNWDEFASRGMCVLDDYYDASRNATHRENFESWVSTDPSFAPFESVILNRSGLGYIDFKVHGAWAAYRAHVPRPCDAPAPCDPFGLYSPAAPAPVDPSKDDDGVPF